ncbi:Major facilitator super domain-containing protein 7 [Sparganum proliferum]
MIGAGIFVAFLVSMVVDKTGSILYGIKVCFALAALGAVGFSVTIWFPDRAVLIAFFVLWFGGFGFSIYGLSLEMAAEATYPVPEMVTTGFMLILSQLLSIVLIMVMQVFAPVLRDSPLQTCGPDAVVKASHVIQ